MAIDAESPDRLPSPGEEGAAVFTVSVGWCGGFGEAVLDEDRHVRIIDGLPLFVDSDGWDRIAARIDLGGTWEGGPVVRVSGRIRIQRRTGRNPSIPGAPKQRYLALLVQSLDDVVLLGEKAPDS